MNDKLGVDLCVLLELLYLYNLVIEGVWICPSRFDFVEMDLFAMMCFGMSVFVSIVVDFAENVFAVGEIVVEAVLVDYFVVVE